MKFRGYKNSVCNRFLAATGCGCDHPVKSAVLGVGCGRQSYLFSTTWNLGARGIIYPVECLANKGFSLDRSSFVLLAVEIYPVGHWQGTGSKLAISLVLSRVTRRGPHGRVGLTARCFRGVALWDSVQWKLVGCLQSGGIINGLGWRETWRSLK